MNHDLRAKREALVLAHTDAENRHDVEATLATFHSPKYEVIPFAGTFDGAESVRALLDGVMRGFPDFRVVLYRLHHADEAVVVEGALTGTQHGEWVGIPATGRAMNLPFVGVFDFDDDRLLCERVYFDHSTLLRQLGVE
jgi:steroid delta-isomerase-like uncharacterized protein